MLAAALFSSKALQRPGKGDLRSAEITGEPSPAPNSMMCWGALGLGCIWAGVGRRRMDRGWEVGEELLSSRKVGVWGGRFERGSCAWRGFQVRMFTVTAICIHCVPPPSSSTVLPHCSTVLPHCSTVHRYPTVLREGVLHTDTPLYRGNAVHRYPTVSRECCTQIPTPPAEHQLLDGLGVAG